MKLLTIAILALAACGDDGSGLGPNDPETCSVMSATTCDHACVGQVVGGNGSAADTCRPMFTTQGGYDVGRACTDGEVVVADGVAGCCIYAGDPALNDPWRVYWAPCD